MNSSDLLAIVAIASLILTTMLVVIPFVIDAVHGQRERETWSRLAVLRRGQVAGEEPTEADIRALLLKMNLRTLAASDERRRLLTSVLEGAGAPRVRGDQRAEPQRRAPGGVAPSALESTDLAVEDDAALLGIDQLARESIEFPARSDVGGRAAAVSRAEVTIEEARHAIDAGIFADLAQERALRAAISAALKAGDRAQAREFLAAALAANLRSEAAADLGEIAADAGLVDIAAKLYLRAMDRNPNDPGFKARLALMLNRYEPRFALPWARELVDQYPDDQDYAELLAQILAELDQQEALRFSESMLLKFPDSTWLLQAWMDAAERSGKPTDEIATRASEFIQKAPVNTVGRAYALLADVLARRDQDDRALVTYEKAFELGGDNPVSRGNYAVELAAVGRFEDAEREFRRAITAADATDRPRIEKQFARFLVRRGRTDEAAKLSESEPQLH